MVCEVEGSGFGIVGNIPLGTHFCQFYQTKEDLLDILIPYFKAGLENNESCVWITSEPLKEQEAEEALRKTVSNFDQYLTCGQIQILPYDMWYRKDGNFNSAIVLIGWLEKLNEARVRGFDSLRLAGNTFWLEKEDWKSFADYEAAVDSVIGSYPIIALCCYNLDKLDATEAIDVIRNHRLFVSGRKTSDQL